MRPVPVISQKTISLCWEACAQMMWKWKNNNLTRYAANAGTFLKSNTGGITESQMNGFYMSLGLRSLPRPQGKNLRHALTWTPVIVTDIRQAAGHAIVLADHSAAGYKVVNPCAVMALNFDTDSNTCSGGVLTLNDSAVETHLGTFMWYW
jgi:hypothetical protein